MRIFISALIGTAFAASKLPSPKVIGGQSIPISEAPFLAVILFCRTPSVATTCFQVCSGSLVAPNVVLTAGRCVRDSFLQWGDSSTYIDAGRITVLLGSSNWMTWESAARVVGVSDITYGSYGMNIRFPMDGDIALLQLSECVDEVTDTIEYAKIATWETEPERASGCANVSIAGFGSASNAPYPLGQDDGKLRLLVDNLHTPEVCRAAYTALSQGLDYPDLNNTELNITAAVLGENFICTGGTSWHSVCYGDSGGPTFKKLDSGKFQIIGVTSFGFRKNYYCTIGPDFSTRVAFYADWIQNEMDTRFTKCPSWDVNSTFAMDPPKPYPESSLSSLWTESRCNPNAHPGADNWQCASGQCIDKTLVCDGTDSCSDASDQNYESTQAAESSYLPLCPVPNRRLLANPTPKTRTIIKNIGQKHESGHASVLPIAKTAIACIAATNGVNDAIETTSSQVTIGDSFWDPTLVTNACSAFASCTNDGSKTSEAYENADEFCVDLDNYIWSAQEAIRWEQSFGSRFNAACANDDLIETLTDAPPTTYSGDSRSVATMSLSGIIGALLVTMATVF